MAVIKIPPGETGRLSRDRINELIDQANKSDNIFAGPGSNVRSTAKSIEISDTILDFLSREPAIEVDVVNTGSEALRAFGLAGINQNFDRPSSEADEDAGEFGDLLNRRVLEVRTPTADDAGCFVILQDGLDTDEVGKAWIGGTTLCILQRWFDSQLLNYADIEDGQTHALAKVQGGLQILWEQEDDSDELTIDTDHFAVVRFTNNFRPMPVVNNGDADVGFGEPMTPENTSGISGGRYSVQRPDQDGARSVYVAQAAIKTEATGRAIFAGAPFLAELDEAGESGDDYGTEEDKSEFRADFPGFKLLADLGIHDGKSWGVLHFAAPFLIKVPDGTYVDEDDPGTPQHPSAPQTKITQGSEERWAIWKFPHPMSAVQLLVTPGTAFNVRASGGPAGAVSISVDYRFALITDDFDIETVKWTGRPPSTNFGAIFLHSDVSGEDLAASNFGAGDPPGQRMHVGVPASAPGVKFYGFYFKPVSITPTGGPIAYQATGLMSAFIDEDSALVASSF